MMVALVWFLLLADGCSPTAKPRGNLSMKQIPPSEFFANPLQVRLASAVDSGDAAGVAAAVRDGADINAWGKGGHSLLYWAMARDNLAGFELLLQHGADVTLDYRDPSTFREQRFRDRVIRIALEVDSPEFLQAALRHGLDPDYVLDKKTNESLLVLAGRRHNEPAMQLLLDAGADINHQNFMGYSPMGTAWLCRDFKTMWFLLERGADPMVGSECGRDVSAGFKVYGSRGVWPDQSEYFDKVVTELVNRGLLTREDIAEADKPKRSSAGGPPGVTVIEHPPDSEAGSFLLRLDQSTQEASERR
jgi:ankyrin repeat protein